MSKTIKKLGISNLICTSTLTSISARVIDFPEAGRIQGHLTFLNFGK